MQFAEFNPPEDSDFSGFSAIWEIWVIFGLIFVLGCVVGALIVHFYHRRKSATVGQNTSTSP